MSISKKFSVFLIFLKILVVCTNESNFTFLITGGYRPEEHTLAKYIVSLQWSRSNGYFGGTHFCEGSILSPRIILTAAHCLWNQYNDKQIGKSDIHIVARTPNRLVKTKQSAIIGIESIRMHPDYNNMNRQNDIAILVLEDEILEDDMLAQRIDIANGPAKEGMNCTVVGWGRIFDGGPAAADAFYVTLQVFNTADCRNAFDFVLDGMLCVGDLNDPEKDVCQGDSGGPLICNGKVFGIVSFGSGCATGMPSFFVDVWHYRKWIASSDGRKSNTTNCFFLFLPLIVLWLK